MSTAGRGGLLSGDRFFQCELWNAKSSKSSLRRVLCSVPEVDQPAYFILTQLDVYQHAISIAYML